MMRKKKNKDDLREYWKSKNFDSDSEILIYQFLCRNIKNKKRIKKIDKAHQFKNYKLWRQHIEEILGCYDEDTISEFYRFARLRERQCDFDLEMHTSTLIPLSVAYMSGILVQKASMLEDSLTGMLILPVVCIVLYFYTIPKDEAAFWKDCLEIIEEYIKKEH